MLQGRRTIITILIPMPMINISTILMKSLIMSNLPLAVNNRIIIITIPVAVEILTTNHLHPLQIQDRAKEYLVYKRPITTRS